MSRITKIIIFTNTLIKNEKYDSHRTCDTCFYIDNEFMCSICCNGVVVYIMQDSYETEYHFSSSRKIGLVLFLIVLVSIPVTLTLINTRQGSQEYSAEKCITRPACLDANPACQLPSPANGWCPSTVQEISPTPIESTPVILTPTPTPVLQGSVQECSSCLAHDQKYFCTNQTTKKKFCFSVLISAPSYTCLTCK